MVAEFTARLLGEVIGFGSQLRQIQETTAAVSVAEHKRLMKSTEL
jgi:hypothetical protein